MKKILKAALLTTLIAFAGFASTEIDPELPAKSTQRDASAQSYVGYIDAAGSGVRKGDTSLLQSLMNNFAKQKRYTTVRR